MRLLKHNDIWGTLDCGGFPRGWLFFSEPLADKGFYGRPQYLKTFRAGADPSSELSHLGLGSPRDRDLQNGGGVARRAGGLEITLVVQLQDFGPRLSAVRSAAGRSTCWSNAGVQRMQLSIVCSVCVCVGVCVVACMRCMR